MFPGGRDLQLCYNEARVCATVRRAKQRVYSMSPGPSCLITLSTFTKCDVLKGVFCSSWKTFCFMKGSKTESKPTARGGIPEQEHLGRELNFHYKAIILLLLLCLTGEVRTINDRNICERRSCTKNNGKSPTFKFLSGEERRPSKVQRVSWGWRLPGATHSSADLTWIRKWLEIQAPELSEPESVELELGSCCSDLDKQVSDEICRTRKRQFEIPFRL